MRKSLAALSLIPAGLSAYITDFNFVDNPYVDMTKRPWHLETFARTAVGAKFNDPKVIKGTKLNYTDGNVHAFYSFHPKKDHAITAQAAYHYIHLGWNENPRFTGQDYHFAQASMAYITNAVDNWRWVTNAGFWVDAETFDFADTGIGYGLLWGRYQVNRALRVHTGVYGYYGIENGQLLPVIGFDTYLSRRLKVNFIFPLDASIRYMINYNWFIVLCGSYFGEFYRMPIRAKGGIGPFKDGIFHNKAKGTDLNIVYNWKCRFTAVLGAGAHYGGSLLIRNKKDKQAQYYNYDPAPYIHLRVHGTF